MLLPYTSNSISLNWTCWLTHLLISSITITLSYKLFRFNVAIISWIIKLIQSTRSSCQSKQQLITWPRCQGKASTQNSRQRFECQTLNSYFKWTYLILGGVDFQFKTSSQRKKIRALTFSFIRPLIGQLLVFYRMVLS